MNRLGLAFVFAASTLLAAPITFVATLNGANQNPVVVTPGTGVALVVLDPVANTMRVEVTFSDLLSDTTASHIHCCIAPPGNVGVATALPSFPGFPLGVISGTFDQTFDMLDLASYNPSFVTASGGTTADAEAALFNGIETGMAYLNIHTTLYPGGEIRGFFAPVPEPGTLGMAALVLMGALLLRRRGSEN
jgi:hypothetical protein